LLDMEIAQTTLLLKTSVGIECEELLARLEEQRRERAGIEDRTIDTRSMIFPDFGPDYPDCYGYYGDFTDENGYVEGARGD